MALAVSARELMTDPRSGLRRQHHLLEERFQAAVREAAVGRG